MTPPLERAVAAMARTGNNLAAFMTTLDSQAASTLEAILVDLDEEALAIMDLIDSDPIIKIGGTA